MPDCVLHVGVAGGATCEACGSPYCERCLVSLRGRRFCERCKYAQVRPELVPPTATSRAAWRALRLAILGFAFAGFLLEPIAIARALRIRGRLRRDPAVAGEGVADAALLIALCGFALWSYGVLARMVLR